VATNNQMATGLAKDCRAFLPLLGGAGRGEGGWRTNHFLQFAFATVFSLLLVFPLAAFAVVGGEFDSDWRFFKGDAAGAEQPGFNDSPWRKLDLPHDWSIEGPFAQTNKTGGAGAWLPSGVGWYRKSFPLAQGFSGQRFFIEFDGVMQNSEVWINGVSLGKRPFGYASFRYELTGQLVFGAGKTNVIAVRADTSAQPASRWYSGAGIYRHVRFIVANLIHVEPGSVFVTTPMVSAKLAKVKVQFSVTNQSAVAAEISGRVLLSSLKKTGVARSAEVVKALPAWGSVDFIEELTVTDPELWDVSSPALYRAAVQVKRKKEMLDVEIVSFGIRQAEFKSDTGFWLNGQNLKLKGVCLHHDGGAFGAAVPLSVWERRLNNLRELGVNAIRTAHNPVAPEFLDLCDRMGFLVMNEVFDCWTVKKNPYDYSLFFNEWSKTDLRDIIRRDRNHPSVILWSVGNEIKDTPKQELAKGILKGLVEVCHENDSTRPVTQALFRPNTSGDYTNGLADLLDVIGTNYRDQELLDAWRAKSGRKIVGTEQGHERRTWLACRDNPQHSGQFLWAGIDYLGESRSWPRIAYAGGLLDRTGEIKPMAYERQSWWSEKPMVKMVRRVAPNDVLPEDPGWGGEERHTQVQYADWTPRNLGPHVENVEVYSNGDEVELFLNDQSLGTQPINRDASPRVWKVTFAPGTLRAVARTVAAGILPDVEPGFQPGGAGVGGAGRVASADRKVESGASPGGRMPPSTAGRMPAATDELRTAGPAARIVLTTDKQKLAGGWDEVAFVRAAVVDENGVVVPSAKDLVRFSITGPGVIAAVDNADNASIEPFQASERRAYQGICFAMIKATGAGPKIVITAEAVGLKSGSVAIETPRK
jgi:beta-galactosidase